MNVESIDNVGLLKPIRVKDKFLEKTGVYELICGEGRLLASPVSHSRVAEYVPDVWESLRPRYSGFGIEVPAITVEQLWARSNAWGVNEVDLLKLDCEGAEYLVIPELSALGLMPRVDWIRGEWHSWKDNALLAAFRSQTHAYNIDANIPHDVGLFIGHRK